MKTLEELYATIRNLQNSGIPIEGTTRKKFEEIEESLMQEKIFPSLCKAIEPLLKEVQRDLVLVVEYQPDMDVPVNIKLSRKVNTSEMNSRNISPSRLKRPISQIDVLESDIICVKNMDWSTFVHGFAVEQCYQDIVFQLVGFIEQGTSKPITIIYDQYTYNARVDHTSAGAVRVLYRKSGGDSLGTILQRDFSRLYNYLLDYKKNHSGQSRYTIPLELRKVLVLKQTSEQFVFHLEVQDA